MGCQTKRAGKASTLPVHWINDELVMLREIVSRLEALVSRAALNRTLATKDVLQLAGISRSTLRRRIRRGVFPPPATDPANGRPIWTPDMLARAGERTAGRVRAADFGPKIAASAAAGAAASVWNGWEAGVRCVR